MFEERIVKRVAHVAARARRARFLVGEVVDVPDLRIVARRGLGVRLRVAWAFPDIESFGAATVRAVFEGRRLQWQAAVIICFQIIHRMLDDYADLSQKVFLLLVLSSIDHRLPLAAASNSKLDRLEKKKEAPQRRGREHGVGVHWCIAFCEDSPSLNRAVESTR
jgi:hypothetical protein